MGWHLEGPFLSAEPGYAGAHDPACMIDPAPALIDELRAAAGGQPLLLTMAPERPGALAAIRHARAHGVRLQLGHTNAPAAILREAADRDGSLWFTHLGNGCPQQLDRHDNILWRALDLEGLGTSLIPDGIHVSPALFRLIHHRKAGRIYYTTDAMSAAGAPPGRHRLGRLELEVGADGVVRQPGRTNLAGSACTPVEGVFRAAAMLGESWAPAWQRFSEIPARLGGCPPLLVPGAPADFCVLRWEDPGGEARGLRPILQTVVGGVMGDPRAAGA
jgi:N-acetylglucosamine-6-phosphate deacetylase